MNCIRTVIAAAALFPLLAGSISYAEDAEVTGVATYHERIALSPEASLLVLLQDVSRQDVAAVEIGRIQVDDPGNPPFQFTIPYDTDDIDPAHTYSVRVSVLNGERLQFTNGTAALVLTHGAPDYVEIALNAVGSAQEIIDSQSSDNSDAEELVVAEDAETSDEAPPPVQGMVILGAEGARIRECETGISYAISPDGDFAALEHAFLAAGYDPGVEVFASLKGTIDTSAEGLVIVDRFIGIWPDQTCENANEEVSLTNTYWKILSLEGTGVEFSNEPTRTEPHIVLRDDESRFSATVGCNQFTGSFEAKGNRVTFGLGAGTLMACAPPMDTWESLLGSVLKNAETWTISNATLEFFDDTGKSLACLVAILPN